MAVNGVSIVDAGLVAGISDTARQRHDATQQRIDRVSSMASRASALSEKEIDSVAEDFEALFLTQMLEQMFGPALGEELFGGKETAQIYKGIMMEQYGKQLTESGGIGVASYVKAELLKLQEV